MKKEVFRVDELVTITNPEIFVRCGYPLCLKDKLDEIEFNPEFNKKISEFLISLGLAGVSNCSLFEDYSWQNKQAFNGIMKAVAFGLLNKDKFGGSERKIITKTIKIPEEHYFRIIGKKIVKTGTRSIDSDGSNMDGDYHSWVYLRDMKSHVILELDNSFCYNLENKDRYPDLFNNFSLQIEEKNVKKVKIENEQSNN